MKCNVPNPPSEDDKPPPKPDAAVRVEQWLDGGRSEVAVADLVTYIEWRTLTDWWAQNLATRGKPPHHAWFQRAAAELARQVRSGDKYAGKPEHDQSRWEPR